MAARDLRHGSAASGHRERAAHLGPERRRPLVLDAAFNLLLERGYEGTSMAAVAEALGVSKPVVYACYPGKEELFKALLRREEARVLGEIQAAIPQAADTEDPEATLSDAFTAFLRAVAASPQAYRVIFMGEGGGGAAVQRRIRRGRELQVEATAAVVRRWLDASGSAGNAERLAVLLAHVIVGLGESGARALLNDPGSWTPESLGGLLGRIAARGQESLASMTEIPAPG
jgi:AcrR family transcriptional regulator